MSLCYESYIGPEISAVVDALAALRMTVFREWPYLYEGDLEYERRYLSGYAKGDALVVVARDRDKGDGIVGASSGMPLIDHADDFRKAFDGSGIDLNNAFYCAESVMLSEYRGQGAGHVFFDQREAHARALGFNLSTFCSVVRDASRSVDKSVDTGRARSLDGFWRGCGYLPLDDVTAQFKWCDIGDTEETEKDLQFWMKRL